MDLMLKKESILNYEYFTIYSLISFTIRFPHIGIFSNRYDNIMKINQSYNHNVVLIFKPVVF